MKIATILLLTSISSSSSNAEVSSMYESSVLVIMIFVLMFHLALLGKLYSKEMSVAADLQLHQVCPPLPLWYLHCQQTQTAAAAARRNEEDADLSPWSLNTFHMLPTN